MKQTIAFYAPLKSPFHGVPSGEQRIAQLFWRACEKAGFQVILADGLRSYDRNGDMIRQQRLAQIGERKANRLIKRWRSLPKIQRPQLWLTYHLYHKAPDYIGPLVTQALDIPYVLVEASYAAKQQKGGWAFGLTASVQAIQHANSIITLNPRDQGGLRQVLGDSQRIVSCKPFISPVEISDSKKQLRQQLAHQWQLPAQSKWLITVAMLRPRDKQLSYHYLSQVLPLLVDGDWVWIVVGDGKARVEIQSYFTGLADRVRWVGTQPEVEVAKWLTATDLFVWPAINEAMGMVFLEAQSAGLPCIAGETEGVASLFDKRQPAGLLIPSDQPGEFANAVRQLLVDKPLREQMGKNGCQHVAQHHSLDVASRWLKAHFCSLLSHEA